jgi:hypothetical protein
MIEGAIAIAAGFAETAMLSTVVRMVLQRTTLNIRFCEVEQSKL